MYILHRIIVHYKHYIIYNVPWNFSKSNHENSFKNTAIVDFKFKYNHCLIITTTYSKLSDQKKNIPFNTT